MSLGSRIREVRKRHGMSITELAHMSKLTYASISRLESEKMHELKSEALKRVANALGVSMDFLAGNADATTVEDIVRSDEAARSLVHLFSRLPHLEKGTLLSIAEVLTMPTPPEAGRVIRSLTGDQFERDPG